jgi:Mrp family chromosome partitioning ATPase
VLLLEADLRRPRLQHVFGLAGGHGLVEAVEARHDLSQEVERVELPRQARWPTNGGALRLAVDVMPAGPRSADPSGVLASEGMRQLLRAAEERYELVLIDAPPLLAAADAVPLLPEVSGVLVVVRIGHTGRSDARRVAEQLRNLRARPLGVVVNESERASGEYLLYAEDAAAHGAIHA